MMDAVREWMFTVVLTTVVLAVLEELIPSGMAGRICRWSGALVLLLVLLQPLTEGDLVGSVSFPAVQTVELAELQQEQDTQWKEYIEQTAETYIWEQAQRYGLSYRATVEAEGESGAIPVPVRVVVQGEYHAELSADITQELGIAKENQIWKASV